MSTPVRSYAKTNRELVAAFERYLVARGQPATTIRAYGTAVLTLVDFLGARSIAEVDRRTLLQLLTKLHRKGLHANTIRLRTCAWRAFWQFIRNAGLTRDDPTLLLAHRKIPHRISRVLTIEEVERLISAARDPFERAVIEVLYSTGVRVSELVKLRLEDIRSDADASHLHSIHVHKGKGGKDRIVLFGRKAARAIRAYQKAFPSEAGFLFEVHVLPARPYSARAILNVVRRVAHRAMLGRVHPHTLRRAFACHMLANCANLRAIQDLLGHERLSTTMLYTHLTAQDLKASHRRFHPHEQRPRDRRRRSA